MAELGLSAAALTDLIFRLARYTHNLHDTTGQLQRYVTVLQSIERTAGFMCSLLEPESRKVLESNSKRTSNPEPEKLRGIVVPINGRNIDLITFCAENLDIVLKDLENLLSSFKHVDELREKNWLIRKLGEWLGEERLQKTKNIFSKPAAAIRWTINETHINELTEAAKHLLESLYKALNTVMLVRNNICQSDTQNAFEKLERELILQAQSFNELRETCQQGNIEVLRGIVNIQQGNSAREAAASSTKGHGRHDAKRWPKLPQMRHSLSNSACSSRSSLVETSDLHKKEGVTMVVIRNDGEIAFMPYVGTSQEELSVRPSGESVGDNYRAHIQREDDAFVVESSSTRSLSLSIDSPSLQEDVTKGLEEPPTNKALERSHLSKQEDYPVSSELEPPSLQLMSHCLWDKVKLSHSQLSDVSLDRTLNMAIPTSATNRPGFCVKTLIFRDDDTVRLILKEPCCDEDHLCEHLVLLSLCDTPLQDLPLPGLFNLTIHQGPNMNATHNTRARISLSVLYQCRARDNHTVVYGPDGTQTRSTLSMNLLLVTTYLGEAAVSEGRHGQTALSSLTTELSTGLDFRYLDHERDTSEETKAAPPAWVFTAVPCGNCENHIIVEGIQLRSNFAWGLSTSAPPVKTR